ncbi:MAG: transposase [Bacteroidales bacterium]
MKRKNFSKTFKENAVKLSYERSSQSALVKELGISSTMLSKWRKEFFGVWLCGLSRSRCRATNR